MWRRQEEKVIILRWILTRVESILINLEIFFIYFATFLAIFGFFNRP